MWNTQETEFIVAWLELPSQARLRRQAVAVARGPRGWWALPFLRQLVEHQLMDGLDEGSEVWSAVIMRLDQVDWGQLRDSLSHPEDP